MADATTPLTCSLGQAADGVHQTLEEWQRHGNVQRLWQKDTSLWSGNDEDRWLGWLDIVPQQRQRCEELQRVAGEARQAGFEQVLLLGMGGSSLCPEVLSRTFGRINEGLDLLVLDSTVPAQVKSFEKQIDPSRTLFIVSSKSGSTSEPNAFKQYFFQRVQEIVGPERAGQHFMAITDPGSTLESLARAENFRGLFHGVPSIGGRYSALSNFGMVPAAMLGIDVAAFLDRAQSMVDACGPRMPADRNPGVLLGIILGSLTLQGRDKVTLIASPGLAPLGAWLEQLLAESIGKHSKGLVPVDGETVGAPAAYGNDRLFVYLRLDGAASKAQDAAVAALEAAGMPIVRLRVSGSMDLGQEFFRWEIATAVACSIVGVNAFDQPDVEASKVATRKLTAAYEETGDLVEENALVHETPLSLYADASNATDLNARAETPSLASYLKAHVERTRPGDYVAINAYVEMNHANESELQRMRHAIRDAKRVATTLGFGPRFLHSTGQLHKGGPNNGVFLQITSDDCVDLPIPGQKSTFGVLKRFQAQGDFEVLAQRNRRALRVHLGPDVAAGLTRLRQEIEALC